MVSDQPLSRLAWRLAARSRRAMLAPKAWLGWATAGMRAVAHGGRLAPGPLSDPDEGALDDPCFLLKQAEQYGPVVKVWLGGKVTTCICGLSLGRRFLSENEGRFRGSTTDFTPLFPHGILRQMIDEAHREYRRIFIEAFKATELAANEAAIRCILEKTLAGLAAGVQPAGHTAIRSRLKRGQASEHYRRLSGRQKRACWWQFGYFHPDNGQ